MKLSFVVPCYNEEGNIRSLYEAVERVFADSGVDWEYVFVDDGSRDGTWQELSALFDAHPEREMRILSFSRNFGKEAGIYAGLRHARGDLICFLDADLQQPPETALEMLRILREDEEADCVTAYQDERNEPKLLSYFKRKFYQTIRFLSDMDFVNGASDFRMMRRRMAEAVLSMPEYHRFSKGIFNWVGFNTRYIPYHARNRSAGETKWSFRKLMGYALEGIVSFSVKPLRLSAYAGLCAFVFSVLYFILLVVKKLTIGTVVSGYPTIVTLLLFFGGLQLLCMGILGEYLAKIFVQVKNRPVFILKEHRER